MKKTMNILEFYEFLKDKPNREYRAILNDGVDVSLFTSSTDGFVWNKYNGDTCRLNDTFTVDMPAFMPNWDSVKEVEYFGKKLLVSKDTKWLATSESGWVREYVKEQIPKYNISVGHFGCANGHTGYDILRIKYEGDWTKSLVEV